jgi:glycerol-3-phosphate dehydrogenase
VLWRRTKHRLHLSEAEQAAFAEWFRDSFAAVA